MQKVVGSSPIVRFPIALEQGYFVGSPMGRAHAGTDAGIAGIAICLYTSDPGSHNPLVARDALHEEEVESRWEAAPAVGLVIASQLLLALLSRAEQWRLWVLPWWVWLIPIGPELALLIPLAWRRPRRRLEQLGHRRTVALVLLGLISLANTVLLLAVIASLVRGDEKSGAQLLLKAITVWGTNVIAFGLWYWAFDRGGPVRRLRSEPAAPRLPVSPDGESSACCAWLAPAPDRLHLRLVHQLDRVQSHRLDAAQQVGESTDALRIGDLGANSAARRRTRGQHLQVAAARQDPEKAQQKQLARRHEYLSPGNPSRAGRSPADTHRPPANDQIVHPAQSRPGAVVYVGLATFGGWLHLVLYAPAQDTP